MLWSSIPDTPIPRLFAAVLQGWVEQVFWQWKRRRGSSLTQTCRGGLSFQCRQFRQSWRQFGSSKRHEASEWKRRILALEMRSEIDLEKARKAFITTDAAGRAVILGSTVSPAWLGQTHPNEDPVLRTRPFSPHRLAMLGCSHCAWPQKQTNAAYRRKVLAWLACCVRLKGHNTSEQSIFVSIPCFLFLWNSSRCLTPTHPHPMCREGW